MPHHDLNFNPDTSITPRLAETVGAIDVQLSGMAAVHGHAGVGKSYAVEVACERLNGIAVHQIGRISAQSIAPLIGATQRPA